MAFTIPEMVSRLTSVTRGERRVFFALRNHLPEDYLVYYNVSVKGRHPDFIIVGPDLGLLVLEVKDWGLDSIAEVTGDCVILRTAEGMRQVNNPIRQARDYTLATVDTLKRRPLLFDGKNLCFGWGYGAIFPFIKEKEVVVPSLFGPTLEEVLEPGHVLTGDDLAPERLLSKLRGLIPDWVVRCSPLNLPQMEEIRGVLYPEIRIGWGYTDEEILRVMDRDQERLARGLGEGHRLIRGVAGSGKTVVLIGRARFFRERHPEWRILVLCYNRVLADYLRETIHPDDNLEVFHFHRWCRHELEAAGVKIPPPPEEPGEQSDYWDREVPRLLLQAYESARLQRGRYQAILVDEGQDFNDDWYRSLLYALDPQTNSLFIAIDSSQTIYRRKASWREIGIQIVGRTKVLRVNYRNTSEILSLAYEMIQDLDSRAMVVSEAEEEYIIPERALRHGPLPEIHQINSPTMFQRLALRWIRTRLKSGVTPEEIMVLGLVRKELAEIKIWLNANGVPAQLLGSKGRTGGVRLSTIHASKGLDAECVLLLNLNAEQVERLGEDQARRLLYIAMTRARKDLCIFYQGNPAFVSQLKAKTADTK